jgi:threonine dehydrogenase-like Zn-dependent dehydrogenase
VVEKVLAAVRTGPSRTEIREYPMPDIAEDAALMKMEVGGICGTDVKLYRHPPGNAPVIMGHENIGTIAKAGREFTRRKGFREGDLVFVEHYVMCGKCEWCHAGQYRHCENTNWRSNPDAIRYGYTSAERAPHLWGGFAQYVYLPWNAVVHHVPKGVSAELAGLVTPMANGVEWSLFDGGVGTNSTVLIQGPGQQGLSQTVICKQAGASLIIVTGTSRDKARIEVAKKLGADHVIDVQREDPLARIMEITGGKGVDVALDCTAGAGTVPILLGIEALKRKGGTIVVQGELAAFPDFPLEKFTVKFITMKSARGHSFRACARAACVEAFSAGADHHPPLRIEGGRPCHPLGRRRGRGGRDPRLAHAVAVSASMSQAVRRSGVLLCAYCREIGNPALGLRSRGAERSSDRSSRKRR